MSTLEERLRQQIQEKAGAGASASQQSASKYSFKETKAASMEDDTPKEKITDTLGFEPLQEGHYDFGFAKKVVTKKLSEKQMQENLKKKKEAEAAAVDLEDDSLLELARKAISRYVRKNAKTSDRIAIERDISVLMEDLCEISRGKGYRQYSRAFRARIMPLLVKMGRHQ